MVALDIYALWQEPMHRPSFFPLNRSAKMGRRWSPKSTPNQALKLKSMMLRFQDRFLHPQKRRRSGGAQIGSRGHQVDADKVPKPVIQGEVSCLMECPRVSALRHEVSQPSALPSWGRKVV